ncbi:MAG TPA: non-homologous end-joining DNA ligase [Solirubrobacterales bacterium]|nr:non-homologous end-joining DNA ligase [Solirubrobacterales bacterium]
MKARLHDRPFSDPAWVFERKLDGIRAIVQRTPEGASLTSRTGRDLSSAYPELIEALEAEPATSFLADGEIVAFKGSQTSFERLQGRMGIHDPKLARLAGIPVFLYLFDLLEFDGHDLRALPLRKRKSALRRALSFRDPVRYTPHRNERGERFFEEACAKGWEGLVAKRADSPYVHARSSDWLKLKCSFEQELVIGGFTPPQGSRKRFGALLVGYYEDGELRFAGKVGTGFSQRVLVDLGERLEKLETSKSPFRRGGGQPRDARWVRPQLVGQFAFSEWTRDGKLRHPRYLGLREDKRAEEVVREAPGRV